MGVAGYIVFTKSSKNAVTPGTISDGTKSDITKDEPDLQPGATKQYNNDRYGISFDYPETWEISESTPEPQPTSPAPVEFGVSTSRISSDKYKTTAVVEVYGKNLDVMSDFFTKPLQQNSSAKLVKTENTEKGKRSVQLMTTFNVSGGSSYVVKQYLFAVGEKTYSIQTINEELNMQADPNYISKFDQLYKSLKIE